MPPGAFVQGAAAQGASGGAPQGEGSPAFLMTVKRIVPNIAAERLDAGGAFYRDILGMKVVMDLGRILTFASEWSVAPQLSVATEGGSGTPAPIFPSRWTIRRGTTKAVA
jgi:hypothetical protein